MPFNGMGYARITATGGLNIGSSPPITVFLSVVDEISALGARGLNQLLKGIH